MLARFDKISQGARTKSWAEAASGNALAFPVHGTWGPRGPSAVPSRRYSRAPRLKERFNYFGDEPKENESRRRAKQRIR